MMMPPEEGTVHLTARSSVKDAIGDLVTVVSPLRPIGDSPANPVFVHTVEITQIIGKQKRYI